MLEWTCTACAHRWPATIEGTTQHTEPPSVRTADPPPSEVALRREIASLRELMEVWRASASRWQRLYEASLVRSVPCDQDFRTVKKDADW